MNEDYDGLCHCGAPVMALTRDPVDQEHFNSGLWNYYCEHCAECRCDAYPGECGR